MVCLLRVLFPIVRNPICLFHVMEVEDLLLDKQEFGRNKVLKVNSLCDSDTMDVSVGRQFEGKIFSFRKNFESLKFEWYFFGIGIILT